MARESRSPARQAFFAKYEYKSDESTLVFFGWASLLLLFVHPGFLALSAVLLVLGYDQNSKDKQKLAEWSNRRND